MNDYYDEIILDMGDKIHWIERKEGNFMEDHSDLNPFIIITESPDKKIDYTAVSYDSIIKKYDNIFTVDIVNEYISKCSHIIHIYGTIGYSADTQDAEFIYDKWNNVIYVCGKYRLLGCDFEEKLFKDTFEICYDKYWKINKENSIVETNEVVLPDKYEELHADFGIPYYRYPRTKDGVSIPRIIYNLFKVFSDPNVHEDKKPKIVIPIFYYTYKQIKEETKESNENNEKIE